MCFLFVPLHMSIGQEQVSPSLVAVLYGDGAVVFEAKPSTYDAHERDERENAGL